MLPMSVFWTTAELLERGKSPRQIRRAVEQQLVAPVRKGHFATPGADLDVVRSVRTGGVATATTASRALGLWTPPDPPPGAPAVRAGRGPDRLHVAVPRNAARLRDPDDAAASFRPSPLVVLHWVDETELVGTGRSRVAPVPLLLKHAFLSLPPEHALAVLDSALHLRFLRTVDLPVLAAALPQRLREVVMAADGRADSGTETIVRYRLRARGLRVEVIVGLRGIGTVDLLVEGRLIIECDGREFHDDDEAFERDRARDLHAARQRYRTLRFTWFMVLFEWPLVEEAVFAALS
jgi:very-short-patch-repair endonuclease